MKKIPEEPTIPCPSCGIENRISSPFCKECGGRIYKDGASPAQAENPRKVAKRHAFRSFLGSLLFLAVVAVFGLCFWPYASVNIPVGADPSRQVERYLEEVNRRSQAGVEIPTAIISQRNLNAFLGQNSDTDTGKLMGALLSESRILFLSSEPLGPFHLSTRLVLKPAEGTTTPYVPTKLWVGHLPLPTSLAPLWTQKLAGRFELDLDDRLWDILRITSVQRNGVVVDVVPRAMKVVVQRVREARVEVEDEITGQIGPGLLLLVGIGRGDTPEVLDWMARKCAGLRIFSDEAGKMNRSVKEIGGSCLAVSQFTLFGDCRKGFRPGFTDAAPPEEGRAGFEAFVELLRNQSVPVETGIFQADMQVSLVNDGPVTILLEKENKGSAREA